MMNLGVLSFFFFFKPKIYTNSSFVLLVQDFEICCIFLFCLTGFCENYLYITLDYDFLPLHHEHFTPGNSLFWGTVLCIVGCLAAFLVLPTRCQ